MSRRLSKSAHRDEEGVNMTPMLDIVFILLIFFIVTAVFLDEKGVDFTKADGERISEIESPVITIVIDETDKISIEGRIVALASVEAEVQRHLVYRPAASISLRAAEKARLENVVTIKDEMEQAGRDVRLETYIPAMTSAALE